MKLLRAKLCAPIALLLLILVATLPAFATASEKTRTTTPPTATPQRPLAAIPDGTWLIGAEVSPGLYAAPGGARCSWKRLSGFGGTPEETIATGGGERPIVEIAQTDRGFATDSCGEWTPLNGNGDAGAPSPTPMSTETRTPTSTRRPTATPSPTGTAVPTPTATRNLEITVPAEWQTLRDDRLGYTYAVPQGWQTIDLPRIEEHSLWGIIKRVFSDVSDQLTDFLKTPDGQRLGYLAVDVDMFPRPTARTIALAAVWPLDDNLPSEVVVQLLPEMLGSIRQVPIDLESVEARIINNLQAIQAVGAADLSSHGLFYAHTVVTVLRRQDNAYLLAVLSPAQDDAADQLIEQVVGSFGPTGPTPTLTPTSTPIPPTRTPTPTPTPTLPSDCKTRAAVTWCVLSVIDHGSKMANSAGHTLTPNGAENNRFIRVRFRARNEAAADMEIMEVKALKLRDGQGREYEHFLQHRGRFMLSWYPDTHIPEEERCREVVSFLPDRPRKLPPNVWTICQALFEVNADATNLVFLANALVGEPRVSVEIPLPFP